MQKLRRLIVLVVMGIGFGSMVSAQASFWNTRDAYLGQRLVGDTPEIFALDLLTLKGDGRFEKVYFSNQNTFFIQTSDLIWSFPSNAVDILNIKDGNDLYIAAKVK